MEFTPKEQLLRNGIQSILTDLPFLTPGEAAEMLRKTWEKYPHAGLRRDSGNDPTWNVLPSADGLD